MNAEIRQRIELDDGGAITLYDWMSEGISDGRNLVRTTVSGRELWRATPPLVGSNECFTDIRLDSLSLKAGTWSGYEVAIDIDTGGVTVLAFTK